MIDVLAAQAPDLGQALERARADGLPHLILDGKVVETDRCREKTISAKGTVIDLWYSGKIHDFGGNIQALLAPGGLPLWVSDVLPGNVHDITTARELVRVCAIGAMDVGVAVTVAVIRPTRGALSFLRPLSGRTVAA